MRRLAIPPRAWMRPNPFKVYEFYKLVLPSGLQAEHRVLDLGSGHGYSTWLIAEKCASVVGIEPSVGAVNSARRFSERSRRGNVEFHVTVLEQADLAVSSFDRIYSFCVLEHINNLEMVLSTAYDILKPGGEMHVTVDSLESVSDRILIAKHRQDHGVFQYFTTESIKQAFETSGFEVMEVQPIMTGSFAAKEFEKRIRDKYRYGIARRILTVCRLLYTDRFSPGESGIMLVLRAKRPA
ncbi:MAG: class I SAM-dependent methyltransferase [Anaerolineae bacterium]|nr:class I SAM-dependent methyltransferase [Anaerolineae bacterium]MCO5207403.1 class I SAM-dependent methyltransferase [Anaerolineae bacterium]